MKKRIPIDFQIKKIYFDGIILRLYLLQAIEFEEKIMDDLKKFPCSLADLPDKEIIGILNKYECYNFDSEPTFYAFHYENFNRNLELFKSTLANLTPKFNLTQIQSLPVLFTDIKEISFDENGLIVLERFTQQVYDLYSACGKMISQFNHDLYLLPNGKYLHRHYNTMWVIDKYCSTSESNFKPIFPKENQNFFYIKNRDRINLITNDSNVKRIENFKTPQNYDQAREILLNPETNYITSPELSNFFQSDKNLACMAISRDILAYSLLDRSLLYEPEILAVVFEKEEYWIEAVISEFCIPSNIYIKNRLYRKKFFYSIIN